MIDKEIPVFDEEGCIFYGLAIADKRLVAISLDDDLAISDLDVALVIVALCVTPKGGRSPEIRRGARAFIAARGRIEGSRDQASEG